MAFVTRPFLSPCSTDSARSFWDHEQPFGAHSKKKRMLFLSLAAKASDTKQVFTPREFDIQRKKCLFDPSFFHGGIDGWAHQNLTNALRLGRERIVLTIIFFLLSNSIRMLYSFSTFICVG